MRSKITALLALTLLASYASAADKLNVTVKTVVSGVTKSSSKFEVTNGVPHVLTSDVFVQALSPTTITVCRANTTESAGCSAPIKLMGEIRTGLTAVVTVTEGADGHILMQFDGHYTQSGTKSLVDTGFSASAIADSGEWIVLHGPAISSDVVVSIKAERR